MPLRQIAIAIVCMVFSTGAAAHAVPHIDIPTVPVGNPGNSADPSTGGLYGSVAYLYRIGTTEVTNAQYAAFLNAVAVTDANGVYNNGMAGGSGGVTRSGSPGSYTYAAVAGRENHPVNYVSFWDVTRFANWLHNGQPTGVQDNSTTEDGTYTLTPAGITANNITRNIGWRWAVSSEHEWYKAAYHQPDSQGGDSDSYWRYPTSSNSITAAMANYGGFAGGITPVGSYASNHYGTFDMGGNMWEWNETILTGAQRRRRGGCTSCVFTTLQSDNLASDTSGNSGSTSGFRVVQAVPPPCVGDLNGDGAVNTADLTRFLGLFGSGVTPGAPGDLNGDGVVNTADLTRFLGRFGNPC